MNRRLVTTSWDDGDPRDLRIADLLQECGISGTFYVPITGYQGRPTNRPEDLRNLAERGFEIGGHTYTHRSLTALPGCEFTRELVDSRKLLEDWIGRRVSMFCYPNGHYNPQTIQAVQASGYFGARTTRMLRTDPGVNRFEIPTTVQAYPHPPMAYFKNSVKGHNVTSLLKYSLEITYSTDWVQFSKTMFEHVLREGGVWHLYGHSWEIEELGLWNALKDVLTYVARRDGVQYVTNYELASMYFSKADSSFARTA